MSRRASNRAKGPAGDLPADRAERLDLARRPDTGSDILTRLFRDSDPEISQAARKSLRQADPARLRDLLKADVAARRTKQKQQAFQRNFVDPILADLANIGIEPVQVPQDQVSAIHKAVHDSGDLAPRGTALHPRVPQVLHDFFGQDVSAISTFIAKYSPIPPDETVTVLDDIDDLALHLTMSDTLRAMGILYDGYRGHLCILDRTGRLAAVVRNFKTTCVRLDRPDT